MKKKKTFYVYIYDLFFPHSSNLKQHYPFM